MRTFCVWLGVAALFWLDLARAQEAPPLVSNARQGYAFEFPRVLAEQRLFGIAYGAALLAQACHDDAAATEAYAQWHARQSTELDRLKDELAAFYFGPRADEANWGNIAATLNLPTRLDLAPERRQAACASLPQALQQTRYDLSGRFRLEAALAQNARAVRVAVQSEACTAHLDEPDRATLALHYAAWQAREDAARADAHARLLEEWQRNEMDGTADDMLKVLRDAYAKPPQAACEKLAAWLDTPAASIEQAFAPAPPPVADVPARQAKEVAETVLIPLPQTPAEIEAAAHATPSDAQAGDTPPRNMFDQAIDYLLTRIKEQAHDPQQSNEPAARH